jgi:ADP-ribosylglycohydrolase
MAFPADYVERVYAGVLGKIIGVYLGRPFEGWSYERIMAELGEVWYYVHEKRGVPLVVTDDDISGTFTFLRALEDYDFDPNLTPEQIGQTWLNYLIEKRTILWWGGMGNSTEHTAFMRLKHGIKAPESGSIATNGKVVAEQIGAQIFIDGWGMICPGDPERAADFARRAGSVSHDGEAIYGAQVVAAMEAQAFVESDINTLLDTAVNLIPRDSIITRVINDLRAWHADTPDDWRATREKIVAHYGYDKYGGNCHMVPNHALIIHALLHGEGDFQKSLMIVNTCGWDTDCNSGNVGCLLGIRNGLDGINNGPDWRGPVADRMYLASADGGRCITDAVRETYAIVNTARRLAGEEPLHPKNGARFHFSLPGSVQGFQVEDSPEARDVAGAINSTIDLEHNALVMGYQNLAKGRAARFSTHTFTPLEAINLSGYSLMASPSLFPGQRVYARVLSSSSQYDILCRFYLRHYNEGDTLTRVYGPEMLLGKLNFETHELSWDITNIGGFPIAEIGIELQSDSHVAAGTVFLDYLTWDGTPEVTFTRTEGGKMWRRAWVNGVDEWSEWAEPFRLIQNEGTGLIIQGTREWTDYEVRADVTPHMAEAAGLAARVQGMKRYYALNLCRGNKVRLVKALDGDTILAEADLAWEFGETHDLALRVSGNRIQGFVDEKVLFDVEDTTRSLTGGGVGLLCTEGRTATQVVRVRPLDRE